MTVSFIVFFIRSLITKLIQKFAVISHESKGKYESPYSRYEDYLEQRSNVLEGLEINMYYYEDPFVAFLRSSSGLMLCNFIKIQSIDKFSWELPFSSFHFFLMSKHLQRIQLAARMLTWFHWLFHFT